MSKSPKKDRKKKPAKIQPQGQQSLEPKGLWKDHPHGTK